MRKLQTPLMMSLILVVGLGVSGCHRQRAEISLKKTQQTVAEIVENYRGGDHEPQAVQDLQDSINRANGLLGTEAGNALELAKKASAEATQLLERVKPREANSSLERATEEIKVADINDLRRIDSDRYQRIRALKNEVDVARGENKWDEVINKCRIIISEVGTGLANLQNQSTSRGVQAKEVLLELVQSGGNQYAGAIVLAVQDDINNADTVAQNDRDYQLAINKYSEAIAKAQEGIDQVLREKSRIALERAENSLTIALIEGAQDFRAEEYNRTFTFYEEMLTQYNAGRYTLVLDGVESLNRRAAELVVQVKRVASDDRINTMQNDVRALENDGIRDYLPKALDVLNASLGKAREIRTRDTEEAFDEIKAISVESREELERVKELYGSLAADRIREAKNNLEQARAVFDEMGSFFAAASIEADSDERTFEALKRSREVEIGKRLEEAALNLNVADLRRQQEENRGAIVLAGEVNDVAARSLNDVYALVAQNAVIELSKLVSRYERDGARQYAVEELARSSESVDVVKASIAATHFQLATQQAAQARAEVELMAQRIAGRATEDLRAARRALTQATNEKTLLYRSDLLAQAMTLIEEADSDLQQEKLKLALEKAQSATTLANQAKMEADLLAAKDSIDNAQAGLQRAQDAGAELYAGREIEEARRLLSSSRSLFASEDYIKAEELASSSGNRSENGLFKRINEAETVIATARAVGGWELDSSTLAEANTRVREARQRVEERRFAEAHTLAIQARSIAEGLVGRAKDHNFTTRTSLIRKNLDEGTKQGINFFQPEDSIAIRHRLAELQNAYSRDDYERVMTDVEKLEAQLRGVLGETDVLVETVAAQQGRRLDSLMDDGAALFASVQAATARESLRYALLDYRRGMYKAAHSNLDRAIKSIDEIERRLHHETYHEDVFRLFEEFRDVQEAYSSVLTLTPAELKHLAVGPNGAAQSVAISAQITPMQFRAKLDELYTRALHLESPKALTKLHENVIEAMTRGRMAALNFEKLAILNRMAVNDAYNLIDSAYIELNTSNKIVGDVQRQLFSDENRHRSLQGGTASLVQQR